MLPLVGEVGEVPHSGPLCRSMVSTSDAHTGEWCQPRRMGKPVTRPRCCRGLSSSSSIALNLPFGYICARMSVTTTSNPLTQTLLHALTDYDLHHSGDPENPQRPADPNASSSATTVTQPNPAWWPNDHRRIPPHRPVNRELDRNLRPGGTNVVEQAFIFTMLRGVQVKAVSHTVALERCFVAKQAN